MHIQIGSKSSWSAFWHCPATQPQTRSVIRASDDGSFVAKGCGPEFHCRMPSSQTLCIWQKNWALRPACSKQVERLAMALAIGGLTGYPRENGRKGVRNLVAVLAAADNVNPLARQLAARNPGVVCLPASYGRGQMGRDFEVSLRAMAGLAGNPALGAFTDWIVDHGGTAVFSEPVECLGGEDLLRKRAVSPEAADRLVSTVRLYDELAREQGIDLAGTNPTPDNLAGGLTSIE